MQRGDNVMVLKVILGVLALLLAGLPLYVLGNMGTIGLIIMFVVIFMSIMFAIYETFGRKKL